MSKRFTDTDKWKKPFIRGLKAPYKLLWFYILDDCDHAGIWQVDMEVACIRTGEDITIEDALYIFGSSVKAFSNNEKWFIKDFIEFQYGELKENNRVHISVIDILKREGLYKTLISPLQGVKDKDKDKSKDKEEDKDFVEFWNSYDKKIGDMQKVKAKFLKLSDTDIQLIADYIPRYKQSQPDKQYRKNPETFLNNKGWLDELITPKSLRPEHNVASQIDLDEKF